MVLTANLTEKTPSVQELDQAIALTAWANTLMKQDRFDEAAQTFEKVLSLVPALPQANLELAKLYLQQGHTRKAVLAALDEMLLNPKDQKSGKFLKDLHLMRLPRSTNINFSGKEAPERWPSISLVMIVRNEEAFLDRCLQSVKELVHEMIIVDTGSTDRTVEIAESYGAKVTHFTWCDDFSAVRNVSLEHATGDWILMMDADNWLEPEDRNKLKWAAATGKADVYICGQVSWKSEEQTTRDQQARLYRNHCGLVYENQLHETVFPSAQRAGLRLGRTNIDVQHEKQIFSDAKMDTKRLRNLQVVEKALERDPQNIFNRLLRGAMLDEMGRNEEAVAVVEPTLEELPDDYPPEIHLTQAHTILATYYARTRQFDKLRHALKRMMADCVGVRWVWIASGAWFIDMLNDPETSRSVLEIAAEMTSEPLDGLYLNVKDADVQLLKLRARTHLYTGRAAEARKLLQSYRKAHPGGVTRCKQEIQQLLADGDYAAAAKVFEGGLPADAEAQALIGKAEAGRARWRQAAEHMALAVALGYPSTAEYWHLAGLYEFKAGAIPLSRRVCRLGLERFPQDASLLNQAGVSAWMDDDPKEAIECFVAAVLADPAHANARENLKTVANAERVSPEAMIRKQGFIWLKEERFEKARNAFKVVLETSLADAQVKQLYGMLGQLA